MEFYHEPIMLNEVLEGLNIVPSGVYLDCTLGGAGHSSEILKRLDSTGLLIGLDKDEEALAYSSKRLEKFENKRLIYADFKNAIEVLDKLGIEEVDGVLIDLGISSHQIDSAERGFSFLKEGRLDMRMDRNNELSAYEIVNFYPKEKLEKILFEYGEESFARRIVQKIVEARKLRPIETTLELREIIESALPKKVVYKSGGASKKTFQALRIAVNGELEGLEEILEKLISRLKSHGRMCVLSFHSLEDRIVKNVFRREATDCLCPPGFPVCTCHHKASIKLITKKPLVAGEEEVLKNPRSSSAKLRIIERL